MTANTKTSPEIPDCFYKTEPILITPDRPTPNHTLYLSNLDLFMRIAVRYVYLFKKAVPVENLKASLSKTLSLYYPFAGRLRAVGNESIDKCKLEVECNGEGALFAEAYIDYSANEFLEYCGKSNESWMKLVYKVNAPTFLDVPPLVIQVTNLKCGGMIITTSAHHAICDGTSRSQFMNTWANTTSNPNFVPLITPFHDRLLLRPRSPPQVTFTHPGFTTSTPEFDQNNQFTIMKFLLSQPLVASSITFNPSQILALKNNILPSVRCTAFDALASHTWKSWVKSLNLSDVLKIKLVFSVNIRKKMKPELPQGYYGNGFVLGCAETTVKELTTQNLSHSVELVQHAKSCLKDEYIRSMIDLLEDRNVKIDLSNTFVITQWSKLNLEHLDFGSGEPLYMGAISNSVYCLFLPVIGEPDSIRVHVNLPHTVAEKFVFYMTENMGN